MQNSAGEAHSASPTLPDELIYHVLLHSSPCEVVRLRLVSKQFNNVARDIQLWKMLYTTARYLRPPGPFSWQSLQSLERILVNSERVSRTWTSQPFKVLSITQGPRHKPSKDVRLLFGRLFVWSGPKQLFSQDLESGSCQVIWETDQYIRSFRICAERFPDALRVFVAVDIVIINEPGVRRIKLLVSSLQDDTSIFGPMTHKLDLPKDAFLPGNLESPLYFKSNPRLEGMVVDTRTCAIYWFPPFHSGLLESAGIQSDLSSIVNARVLISGAYIVALTSFWPSMLIQIFTVPNLPHPGDSDPELCLTHEMLSSGPEHLPELIHTIRDPVTNPVTGDTTLRFLGQRLTFEADETLYYCLDLIMPATRSDSTEILPVYLNKQRLFQLRGCGNQVDLEASSDGYVRGLVRYISGYSHLPPHGPITDVYKISVDASAEVCRAVVSEVVKSWELGGLGCDLFDGVRGRLCYTKAVQESEEVDLVVLGLQ